jgi:hypothetical protein
MIYAIVFIILAAVAGLKGPTYSCDPALAAVLTPPRPLDGHYEVCTTPSSIDDVLADVGPQGPSYGSVEAIDPLDALGTGGAYDRSALARLYGGRRARVARGWMREGRALVSITLVSPYPNRTLTALVSGTLVVRYTVESREL